MKRTGFSVLILGYHVLVAIIFYLDKKHGPVKEPKIKIKDILLLAFATQRLSRIITKDKVAMPVRSPFTKVQGAGLPGEIESKPTGHGLRKAIGTLLVCPYCVTVWIATIFTGSLRIFPRQTRMLAQIFTIVFFADIFQVFYAKAKGSLVTEEDKDV